MMAGSVDSTNLCSEVKAGPIATGMEFGDKFTATSLVAIMLAVSTEVMADPIEGTDVQLSSHKVNTGDLRPYPHACCSGTRYNFAASKTVTSEPVMDVHMIISFQFPDLYQIFINS